MPLYTPEVMRFNDSLVELAEAGSKIGFAAAMAIANPGGVSDEVRFQIGKEVDDMTASLGRLHIKLVQIGQRDEFLKGQK